MHYRNYGGFPFALILKFYIVFSFVLFSFVLFYSLQKRNKGKKEKRVQRLSWKKNGVSDPDGEKNLSQRLSNTRICSYV